MAANDFNKVTPMDARLLLSRESTGVGGDDNAPTPALASTEYVETSDLVSVRVFAYGDDTTGAGQTFTITPWYYVRSAGRDPLLGGVGDPVWHMGKPVPVLLGYDDADANKGFVFDTQGAERMFFQVTDVPGALAWGRTDIYVDLARWETQPVHVAGIYSALKALFNFSAGGGLLVDTELTLDATNVFINNAFSFAINPAAPTTAGFAKMNATNQAEIDTMLLGGNAINLGAGTIGTGTQRVTLGTDDAIHKHVTIQPTHYTPRDGNVVYTSNVTITAAGFDFAIDDANCLVLWIDQISVAGVRTRYVNGQGGVSISSAANIITLAGAGTPFVGTDIFDIGVLSQIKGYQAGSQSYRVSETNPPPSWGPIGPESILAAAQDVTAAWVDLGAEISMVGFTHMGVWVNLDINNSENVRIRAIAKHTAAGADEYFLPIESISASDIKIQDEYFEFNDDVDQRVLLKIPTDNLIPYIQLQVTAGVVGATAGQIDSLYITRSWAGSSGR